jgi:hypothetical protein
MIVKTKLMKALGFKGSGMFVDSPSYSHYYKAIPEARCVLGLGNSCPSCIYVFRLTPEQYRAFERGKLGLVPPGCCNATGGTSVEDPAVLYEGPFETARKVTELLNVFEATLRGEKDGRKQITLRHDGQRNAHAKHNQEPGLAVHRHSDSAGYHFRRSRTGRRRHRESGALDDR